MVAASPLSPTDYRTPLGAFVAAVYLPWRYSGVIVGTIERQGGEVAVESSHNHSTTRAEGVAVRAIADC